MLLAGLAEAASLLVTTRKAEQGGAAMRLVLVAVVAATATLTAASMLGVAAAEAPTTTSTTTTTATATTPPLPTVSVQGVATETIEQSASAGTATAVYRQGMADAIGDGQAKAQFLAGKAGVSLGAVQSIAEDGGSISCAEVEYTGEQPDFGYPGVSSVYGAGARGVVAPQTSTPVVHKPAVKRRKHHAKGPLAKRATAASGCTLSAQVALVYALS
jgi:hypothetical protein